MAAGNQTVQLDNVRITSAPILLKIQRAAGGQARLWWPTATMGYTLKSSSGVSGGDADAGLTVTQQGNENVACDFIADRNKFYVFVKP